MNNYQQPPPANPDSPVHGYDYGYQQQNQQMAPIVTFKEWLITMLIMIIPIVNVIMMFVYAFGEGNPSKKNYFKASLLIAAIILGIYAIIIIFVIAAAISASI